MQKNENNVVSSIDEVVDIASKYGLKKNIDYKIEIEKGKLADYLLLISTQDNELIIGGPNIWIIEDENLYRNVEIPILQFNEPDKSEELDSILNKKFSDNQINNLYNIN